MVLQQGKTIPRSKSLSLLVGMAFLLGLLSAAPVASANDRPAINTQAAAPGSEQHPSELAREGLTKMMQVLDKLIESVPRYEMPAITENGDIILKRKNPPKTEVPLERRSI